MMINLSESLILNCFEVVNTRTARSESVWQQITNKTIEGHHHNTPVLISPTPWWCFLPSLWCIFALLLRKSVAAHLWWFVMSVVSNVSTAINSSFEGSVLTALLEHVFSARCSHQPDTEAHNTVLVCACVLPLSWV